MEKKETLAEIMDRLAAVNKKTGFKAREIEVDEDGAMILDAKNPHDVQWWKDDEVETDGK